MQYYNITTNRKTSILPRVPNTLNANWNNFRAYYVNEGWRELIPATIPEGYGVISRTYTDNHDNTVTEVVEIDTFENIAAAAEAKRIVDLLANFGEKVTTLSVLLALFDITLPTTQAEATPIIYAKAKADLTLMADALLVLTVYQDLRNYKSDEEIYEIYELLLV